MTGGVLGLLYDYAGDLRDRNMGLVLTVGGSVAVLAVLALLITSVAPGHFNWSVRRLDARPGRQHWLTVRQKSPYCFISGRNRGTT